MDNIKDILENRAESLGENTYDVMTEVKLVILDLIKVEVRVLGINNDKVKIATEDAPAASEIRLNKTAILHRLASKKLPIKIKDIVVVIR